MKIIVIFLLLILHSLPSIAQFQSGFEHLLPPSPQPSSLAQPMIRGFKPNTTLPNTFGPSEKIRRQNEMMRNDVENHQRQNLEQQKMIVDHTSEFIMPKVSYSFPYHIGEAGTEYFYLAQEELIKMNANMTPLSLKKAVFAVEQAYDTNIDEEWYETAILQHVENIRSLITQSGYKLDNASAKKWAIHHYFTDTIIMKDNKGNSKFVHYPFTYDFVDPFGKQAWTNQFVTKLLSTGKGQCHSMPLLYLILAEELGVEAWLAYSPSHSYIKIRDTKGNMLNYETTNGHYVTDAWIQSGGYIKAEAVRSKIYMDTVSRKQMIASSFADMAKGYAIKYGLDRFVVDCLDRALAIHPNNIYALSMKADYQTILLNYVVRQLKINDISQLNAYPEAYKIYTDMLEIYATIDRLGLEDMPEEFYKEWLNSFEQEKSQHPTREIKP